MSPPLAWQTTLMGGNLFDYHLVLVHAHFFPCSPCASFVHQLELPLLALWGPDGQGLGTLSAAALLAQLSPSLCDGVCTHELRVGPVEMSCLFFCLPLAFLCTYFPFY